MFIGGGSAGTAGGLKVGTFALLGFVITLRDLPSIVVTLGMSFVWSGLAVLILAVASLYCLRSPNPILDLNLLRIRTFRISFLTGGGLDGPEREAGQRPAVHARRQGGPGLYGNRRPGLGPAGRQEPPHAAR